MDASSINGFLAGLALAYVFYLNNELNNLKIQQITNTQQSHTPIHNIDIDPSKQIKHSVLSGFKQIGILKSVHANIVLPLYAKNSVPTSIYHSHINFDTKNWQYYCLSHDNGIMIPLDIDKNDCMTDEGCRELHNNDEIYISIYNTNFKVKIYNIDMLHHE